MTIFVNPPFFAEEQAREQRKGMPHNNKKKHARAAQQQLAPHPPPQPVASDYDTDTAYLTETQVLPITEPPPNRSPAQLNMLVLRRWYPAIINIRAIAPFAVLYAFSQDSQSWEKCDTQGSLFVVQLSSLEGSNVPRYKVIILNRRNPKNFELDLTSSEHIEVTDQFVIIPYMDAETSELQIHGIWVFQDEPEGQEDARAYIASVILECATLVKRAVDEEHISLQEDAGENGRYNGRGHESDGLAGHVQQDNESQQQTLSGQPIDLATLFGKPGRQQEQPVPHQDSGDQYQYHEEPQRFEPTTDTAFFRDTRSPAGSAGVGPQAPSSNTQQNALLNLFKNAKNG